MASEGMEEEEEEISRELTSWRYVWSSVSRSVNLMILGRCCRSAEDGGRPPNYSHMKEIGWMNGNSEIMCLSTSTLLLGIV